MDRADQQILEQLNKEVSHERKCGVCGGKWRIEEQDLDILRKIIVPVPDECPECNLRHRMVFRNEANMYSGRKCEATGQSIISVYSPDKKYKVYDKKYWYSDDWNPLDYGQEYDSKRSFFDQLSELMWKVPYPNLLSTNSENSDYASHAVNCSNCYCVAMSLNNEDCYYGRVVWHSKNCVDCRNVDRCIDCYWNVKGINNNYCIYLINSKDCFDCHFSINLTNCQYCILSSNLKNKSYYIYNQPVSREEFVRYKQRWDFREHIAELEKIRVKNIVRFADVTNCENCVGNEIIDSKDCYHCFGVDGANNCRYCIDTARTITDSYYVTGGGVNGSLQYNSSGVGVDSGRAICCNVVYPNSNENYYSYICFSTKNTFGCVSLRQKQYCVLNKQYSKNDYFALIEKIKLDMLARGEYGNYFPVPMSHFGYNETVAQEIYPMTREQALAQGYKWSDYDASSGYSGPWYKPADDINVYTNEAKARELLGGVLRCEVTGRPYKIVAPELAFYLKMGIPVPRKSPDQRMTESRAWRNPYYLWHRQCMCTGKFPISTHSGTSNSQFSNGRCEHEGRCKNMFETTYAPERTEKVYCEECYQKSIL